MLPAIFTVGSDRYQPAMIADARAASACPRPIEAAVLERQPWMAVQVPHSRNCGRERGVAGRGDQGRSHKHRCPFWSTMPKAVAARVARRDTAIRDDRKRIPTPLFSPVVNTRTITRLNQPAARPATDHQLLIQAIAPASDSPLLALSRRISDAGCNLAESRVATVGADVSVLLLARGAWDAVAKLETALGRIGRDENVHLLSYRTQARDQPSHLL
ncbi:MAG: ACT domain-containing protein, partial [Rhodanobacteraceae bacterium]